MQLRQRPVVPHSRIRDPDQKSQDIHDKGSLITQALEAIMKTNYYHVLNVRSKAGPEADLRNLLSVPFLAGFAPMRVMSF